MAKEDRSTAQMAPDVTATFLALGDSYTIGDGVAPGERWPMQLVARLHSEGLDIADPQILAATGWTTDELANAMEQVTLEPPYALVSLLIGVNNQYRGWSVDEYRAQLRGLLQRAIRLAGSNAAHVIVVSIPDWSATPFAAREGRDAARIAQEIDAFNAVARVQARDVGAHWVDVTAISRAPGSRNELAGDGLHPSGAQYARWVEACRPVAQKILTGD
jgi:lysophospholipase L1-like esterase